MKTAFRSLLSALLVASSPAPAYSPADKERLEHAGQCPDGDLSHISYGRRDFSSANLQGANLRGSAFCRTTFKNANLRNADLRGSVFLLVDFTGADLTGARTGGALFFLCSGR